MQPQGHVQLLVSMIDYGVEPQLAIERPRFCIDVEKDASREADDADAPCSAISVEPGFDGAAVERLRAMGHRIDVATFVESHGLYGRAQIIRRLSRPVRVALRTTKEVAARALLARLRLHCLPPPSSVRRRSPALRVPAPSSFFQGCEGVLWGASDPRADGCAMGW